jgi:hypothetical protein
MNGSGPRFWGVLLVFVGLYVLIEWGLLGKSPIADASMKSQAISAGNLPAAATGPISGSLFVPGSAPFSGFGESLGSLIAKADQAGLSFFHGGSLAHDMDYAIPAGTPVALPTGPGCYTYLGNQTGGWGNLLGFSTPNGGVIEFAHFSQVASLVKGTCYAGGTPIGASGGRPGVDVPNPAYSSGPHLAVIVDNSAYAWLNKLMFGSRQNAPVPA